MFVYLFILISINFFIIIIFTLLTTGRPWPTPRPTPWPTPCFVPTRRLMGRSQTSLRVAVPTPREKTGGRERLRKAGTNRVM